MRSENNQSYNNARQGKARQATHNTQPRLRERRIVFRARTATTTHGQNGTIPGMGLVGIAPQLGPDVLDELDGVLQGLVGREVVHHLLHGRVSPGVSDRLGFPVEPVLGAQHKGPKVTGEAVVDEGIEHRQVEAGLPAHDDQDRVSGTPEVSGDLVVPLGIGPSVVFVEVIDLLVVVVEGGFVVGLVEQKGLGIGFVVVVEGRGGSARLGAAAESPPRLLVFGPFDPQYHHRQEDKEDEGGRCGAPAVHQRRKRRPPISG